MTNMLSIGTQIDTPLQLIGLLIVAIVIVIIAVIVKQIIVYIGACILKYRKVDVKIGKGDLHTEACLRR